MAPADDRGASGRRLVFMGSPEFALPSLQALLDDGWQVPLVLSQPDRPAGRGQGTRSTAISAFARSRGLPLETPDDLLDPGLHQRLRACAAHWFVVVAYRLLPAELLALAPGGAINLHASLLPDFRGAAPIQRAILAGCTHSGLSTFRLEAGVDTGPILLQEALDIDPLETGGQLHDRMSLAGAQLLRLTLAGLAAGTLEPRPQPDTPGLRRAPKLGPRTRRLDFTRSALEVHNRIRALAPAPGAQCQFRGRMLQLLESRPVEDDGEPGAPGELRIRRGSLRVCCGEGQVEILSLKPEGKGAQRAADWLNGVRPGPEDCFTRLP